MEYHHSSSASPTADMYPESSTVSPMEVTSLTGEDTCKMTRLGTKPLKDKTCLVCGDKALGYNFNAVSCESCKAFFRRNAFKEIRGRCEGKCEVTTESRSYCKRCRLQKCFTVGMKRDLILNDQQRQVRRAKIEENRLRRHGLPIPAMADSVEMDASCSSSTSSSMGIKEEKDSLTHTIASEVDPQSFSGLPVKSQELLLEAQKAFQASFDCPMDREPMSQPSSADFLNMADLSVRRLVRMAKHINVFRCLHQEDQIALLKGSVVEVLILRSSKMFDTATMGWLVKKDSGSAEHVSAAGLQFGNQESVSFFQQYQRFATSLLTATQKDNVILMLMIIITVLSPDREKLQRKDQVSQAQELYANILSDYMKQRYPGEELMFPRVMQKLADIRELNETHTQMLMHMKVDELEPLIVEIFDMNS